MSARDSWSGRPSSRAGSCPHRSRMPLRGSRAASPDAFESIFSGGVDTFQGAVATRSRACSSGSPRRLLTLLVFRPVVSGILGAVGLGGVSGALGLGGASVGGGGAWIF